MNFKESLKKEADSRIAGDRQKQRIEEERARNPIPAAELKNLAEDMAARLEKRLKGYVSSGYFKYDHSKVFKNRKINFRYEATAFWLYHPITRVEDRIRYGAGKDLIPKSIYFTENDHDMSPTDLYCSKNHLEQLLTAVRDILEKDGCEFTWKLDENRYKSDELNIKAFIKCDKDGRII